MHLQSQSLAHSQGPFKIRNRVDPLGAQLLSMADSKLATDISAVPTPMQGRFQSSG